MRHQRGFDITPQNRSARVVDDCRVGMQKGLFSEAAACHPSEPHRHARSRTPSETKTSEIATLQSSRQPWNASAGRVQQVQLLCSCA